MIVYILSFTDRGRDLGSNIADRLGSAYKTELFFRGRGSDGVPSGSGTQEICAKAFRERIPLVFIGAAGIAVRSVAPYVKDKLTDPPVIVIDELGRFVIPLLSGHAGGANRLADEIASAIGAVPVITTATDINGAFSVDVFAAEQGLSIADREGIAKVSTSALAGKAVTLAVKDYPPAGPVDVIVTDEVMPGLADITLCPKRFALGMGCRRGKPYEDLRGFAEELLAESGISREDVGCIATIDIKQDEEGLRRLAQAWRVPLITYEAAVLAKAPGEFSSSELVAEKVGVDNVCERAAVIAAGAGSQLVIKKTARDGMTLAAAERRK